MRGAIAIVTNVRWDAVDAKVSKANGAIAYGEIVRVRRPGAGVKFRSSFLRSDGGKKAGHQDDHV